MSDLQYYRVKEWFSHNGDNTYRLKYNLNNRSVVVDAGGFKGDFAYKMHKMYDPYIFIFEPVADYVEILHNRFKDLPKVKIYPHALGRTDRQIEINVLDDASSIYKSSGKGVLVNEVRASKIFKELDIKKIDLIKINVEGSEYDILEDLNENNWLKRIKDLQVQFHDFVDDPESKIKRAHEILKKTHCPTYAFKFVWENWTKQSFLTRHIQNPHIQLEVSELRDRIALMEKMIDDMQGER